MLWGTQDTEVTLSIRVHEAGGELATGGESLGQALKIEPSSCDMLREEKSGKCAFSAGLLSTPRIM